MEERDVLEVVVERDHRRLVGEDDPEQDDREHDPVAEEAHRPERVAGADREHRRDDGDRRGDDEARLEAGREAALRPGRLEAREVEARREREAGHEVGLLVQREEEDREHGVDREHREQRQHAVGAHPLEAARRHRALAPVADAEHDRGEHEDRHGEDRRDGRRVADLVVQKRVLVHVHRGDERLAPRAAGRRVVDDVEAPQRVDRRQDEGDEDLAAQARQASPRRTRARRRRRPRAPRRRASTGSSARRRRTAPCRART